MTTIRFTEMWSGRLVALKSVVMINMYVVLEAKKNTGRMGAVPCQVRVFTVLEDSRTQNIALQCTSYLFKDHVVYRSLSLN